MGANVVTVSDRGSLNFDLWTSNLIDLLDAGIPREQIEIAGIDTFLDAANYFSHRRDGAPGRNTGRFGTVVALRRTASP